MDAAIALDTELGNGSGSTVADMVDASHNPTKLPCVMVSGGVGEAAAALFRTPAGLFVRTSSLFYSYYGVLVAIVLFGLAEAWAGLWVSHDPLRRRAVGMTVLWVSHDLLRRRAVGMTVLWVPVLPLLFLAGDVGHVILE